MTYDIDIEDYSLPEYIAMHIISKGPVFKSQVIRQAIRDFGDIIEHGPYLYGEYSDDIDETETVATMRGGSVVRLGKLEGVSYSKQGVTLRVANSMKITFRRV